MCWDQDGVWFDQITKENGEWLIGNHLPEDHPGYIDPTDVRGFLVKYWLACRRDASRKYLGTHYGGGHETSPPPQAHDGQLEGVQVLSGGFWCEHPKAYHCYLGCEDAEGSKLAKDTIELKADEYRRWYLGDSDSASGVTICRFSGELPDVFGVGEGYEYHVLDTESLPREAWPRLLSRPAYLTGLGLYQLTMVFQGALRRVCNGAITHKLWASKQDYVYTRPGRSGDWLPDDQRRTKVVSVYY